MEAGKASLCLTPMRGKDTQQSAMFSYVSPEQLVPADHPPAADPEDGGCGIERTVPVVPLDVRRLGAARDRAGEATASAAVASFVFDPK